MLDRPGRESTIHTYARREGPVDGGPNAPGKDEESLLEGAADGKNQTRSKTNKKNAPVAR